MRARTMVFDCAAAAVPRSACAGAGSAGGDPRDQHSGQATRCGKHEHKDEPGRTWKLDA
jgi:hypothetical protein